MQRRSGCGTSNSTGTQAVDGGGVQGDRRAQLLPSFGALPLEAITSDVIERWLSSLSGAGSSRTKALVLLHGILKPARKVWGLQVNAAAEVEKPAGGWTASEFRIALESQARMHEDSTDDQAAA